ncbi:hypothetical protein GTO89_04125 [Heliobacterium gestii]|uniref:Uncharacterized protein n=1 Tax=Heliomicrobium gestii TaxID=2699 RepID=A0A845LH90_HELGE|nr:hypothetical protein [Heliomicrobium gestii]MBM7866797.1 hypothetical protein [Heliomicrobium gestii]MZP42226.1 hypothetical protein [Heliomicrobium gestii]
MAEKTILAFFSSPEAAEAAKRQLVDQGYGTVQVDRVSHMPNAGSAERVFSPLTGDERRSLTSLVEGIERDNDTRVMAAAMPTASGMADGATFVSGENYLVTVVCDGERQEAAKGMLASYGGNVDA